MGDRRRARRFALLAVAFLFGLSALAARLRAEEMWLTLGAFVAFVGCGARAVSLWHWDEIVFEGRTLTRPSHAWRSLSDSPERSRSGESSVRPHLGALSP